MVVMRTEKSKQALIDFCKHINNITPACKMEIIEIGSFAGDSTKIFCSWFKSVIAIDPWVSNIGDITDRVNMNEVYKYFIDNTRAFSNLRVIKDFSYNAIHSFKNFKCDLVYIDGGHTYEEVKQDLSDWLPIVKNCGFIAGHDYCKKFPGVMKAVDEIIEIPDKIFPDSSWLKRI